MDLQIMDETRKEAEKLIGMKRISEALPLIRQLAHWGDLQAQQELIDVYYNHKYGVERNLPAAYEYARLAALNQDVHAMTLLGKLLLNGEGCRKDPDTALYFLGKAADQDDPEAIDEMAMVCLKGLAGPRDLEKARQLNHQALSLTDRREPENEVQKRIFREIRTHAEMIEKYINHFSENT